MFLDTIALNLLVFYQLPGHLFLHTLSGQSLRSARKKKKKSPAQPTSHSIFLAKRVQMSKGGCISKNSYQRKRKGVSEVNFKTSQLYSKGGSIVICEISGHKTLIQIFGNGATGKNSLDLSFFLY